MTQPPDPTLLASALDRASRELDPEVSDWVAETVTSAWHASAQHGHHQAMWCAMSLLHLAARLRQQGLRHTADVLDRCAESAILGWAGEITVQRGLLELELI
jgi:hypothetical protein